MLVTLITLFCIIYPFALLYNMFLFLFLICINVIILVVSEYKIYLAKLERIFQFMELNIPS